MTVAAVYLRVSKSDGTDDESLSLETQRRRIRGMCTARDWEYGPEYIDEGGLRHKVARRQYRVGADALSCRQRQVRCYRRP